VDHIVLSSREVVYKTRAEKQQGIGKVLVGKDPGRQGKSGRLKGGKGGGGK
jgi:hypothetical protein